MSENLSPTRPAAEWLDMLLSYLWERRGTDLHLTAGSAPLVRIDGALQPVPDHPVLTPALTDAIAATLLDETDRATFEKRGDVDFAFGFKHLARVRGSAYAQRGSTTLALRMIPSTIPAMDELGLPEAVQQMVDSPSGLILVTGPTGSGKSTSLAGMIDAINRREQGHIITLEDPIEYAFVSNKCAIEQREVGSDVPTFASGLRHALRQDPDTILVGEMRDLETTSSAITAAETGHLVFSTLHTINAPQTIERIIDIYPSDEQNQIRSMLANTLQAVISQTLFKRCDQPGMIPGVEVMLCTPAVRNCIRENRIFEIPNVIETSRGLGMQTLDSSIKQLFVNGYISREDAIAQAAHPEKLERALVA